VKETKITPHKIPETMYNFAMFDDIVNGFVGIDYLIGTIFEYLRNDNLNMLMSLCCLILVFVWRCYWWDCWNWSVKSACEAKESGFFNERWYSLV